MPNPPDLPPLQKEQTFKLPDGREVLGADVADAFDPSCRLGCDAGLLTRGVPGPGGKTVPSCDVCPCAVGRWVKANPKPLLGETAAHG